MTTINTLLRYKFNRAERRYLKNKGFINGCGGKGGFSFSDSIMAVIKTLKNYNQDFLVKLLRDLERLCGEHDIDFTLGGNIFDFIIANYRLSYKTFKLLHWGNFFGRLGLFFLMFILLNKHGRKYFNFGKKKKLEDLFIHFNN